MTALLLIKNVCDTENPEHKFRLYDFSFGDIDVADTFCAHLLIPNRKLFPYVRSYQKKDYSGYILLVPQKELNEVPQEFLDTCRKWITSCSHCFSQVFKDSPTEKVEVKTYTKWV